MNFLLGKYKEDSEKLVELQALKTALKVAKTLRLFWILLMSCMAGCALFVFSLYNLAHQLIATKGTLTPHIWFDLFLLIFSGSLIAMTLLERNWVKIVLKNLQKEDL